MYWSVWPAEPVSLRTSGIFAARAGGLGDGDVLAVVVQARARTGDGGWGGGGVVRVDGINAGADIVLHSVHQAGSATECGGG